MYPRGALSGVLGIIVDHVSSLMFEGRQSYKESTAGHSLLFTEPSPSYFHYLPVFLFTMNQLIMLAMAVLACLQPTVYAQRSGTTRGNSYIGCNTYTPALGSDTYYAQSSTTTYESGLACSVSHNTPKTADKYQNACSARSGGSFSFFSAANRTCICSQNFPTTNNYGSGNQGACASGSNEVYRLRTTFSQYQSYPCRALSSINLSFTTVNGNINSCYQQCKSFTYAVYLPVSPATLSFKSSVTYLRPAAASIDVHAPMTLLAVD